MDSRELQIAWAAGFLDGEGCFSLSKTSGKGCHETTRNPTLHACQIKKAPLEKLAELFGGAPRVMRVNGNGLVIYQWSIGGRRLIPVLEELLPFLVGKQGEAQAVLDYCNTIGWLKRGKRADPFLQAHRRAIIKHHASARAGDCQHG